MFNGYKNETPTATTVEASESSNIPAKGNKDMLTTENQINTPNTLASTSQNVTMSSIDFLNNFINPARVSAGESEIENRHFIARIEDEIDDLGVTEKFYVTTSQGAKRGVKGYSLNMEQMTLVGMRESKSVRRSVLQKLKMLNKPIIDPVVALDDPEFLRGTLLTYTEKVIALEHKVDEMKPDVAALERIAKSDGAMCITDAAKQLQTRPKQLFDFLSERKWIYRRLGSTWIGYQDKIQQGLIEHKVTTITRTDGIDETKTQVRITSKGIAKLAKLLSVEVAA
ncbi:phage antirepressor KilAC domain-containing protein [Arsenophonus sp. aPb]|uniref:phage antirepressor KilAC domain-containing protein n=1 Tax=Arsenophonus sp. aPb TaxID=3041619 RepID=UPI002469572E|nr:phage antirepressor KilAC domain-containing protein [Arsenophonus sp. aPb]WGL99175.1 phage antirepressor KilAC domain-containing protein [Arsenophonus sp. aPb]